jgi:DNA-3-methyladenine glycosylase
VLCGGSLIPGSFYLRPVEIVARELVGQHLCRDGILLRITEVEAYGGPEDSASHARHGQTPRNAPMWEAGGRAYIYFCYGMHHMLNLVTGPAGEAAAVLIRACEPVTGLEEVQARRGGLEGPELLAGPGRVAQALALDRTFNDHPLFEAGGLELRKGKVPERILVGPRVGIDFADPEDRGAFRRFAAADTRWVTRRRELH